LQQTGRTGEVENRAQIRANGPQWSGGLVSRYGLSRFKYLWAGLPIIALSFLVHAAFDARIAFAEQFAVDTLNL
jgi:hypothetical protein